MEIGDTVRIHINREWEVSKKEFYDGNVGVIVAITQGEWRYEVEIVGDGKTMWDESELEVISDETF